jgi:hypothetical protein
MPEKERQKKYNRKRKRISRKHLENRLKKKIR